MIFAETLFKGPFPPGNGPLTAAGTTAALRLPVMPLFGLRNGA